jgi:uncharacterized protein (TIGR02301 family)
MRCRPVAPASLRTWPARLSLVTFAAFLLSMTAAGFDSRVARAQSTAPDVSDTRPYDDKLMRLSEILGALHYLRELCGGNEGQAWRERMRELIDTDKGSALRRVRLTKSFNQGYRSYRRTYTTCGPAAQATLTKFVTEGVELSDLLLRETQ